MRARRAKLNGATSTADDKVSDRIVQKSEDKVTSKPAAIVCEIIPRPSLGPDELKALAEAIETWHQALSGWEWDSGILIYLHDIDLKDLRRGELPLPAGLRVVSNLRRAQELLGTNISLPTMRDATTTLGTKRSVCLLGQPGEYYSEEALFSSLRHFIPAELVADVRIGATSWNT